MQQKVGRNDPCPCGSGKKYKNCCQLKIKPAGPRKLTAKWINAPSGPNLIERAFGEVIAPHGEKFTPMKNPSESKSSDHDATEQTDKNT